LIILLILFLFNIFNYFGPNWVLINISEGFSVFVHQRTRELIVMVFSPTLMRLFLVISIFKD